MPHGVRTFRIQESCNSRSTLPLPRGLLSAEIRQVFWLASHPPGAFPTLRPVAFMPFVIAYSGGSAGESLLLETHPSSLSSP